MNTCEIVEIKRKENSEKGKENSERKNFSVSSLSLSPCPGCLIYYYLNKTTMNKEEENME
jgi:hypothetical protein